MAGVPTFVVGAGGAGIDVLCRIHDLGEQTGESDHLGYLAIDSDRETLEQTPNEVPDIHLTSDSGIVGQGLESYPYLATDVIVPEAGANRMRHVGRYKMDNPVSPGFTNHYNEIKPRLEQFYNTRRASLDAPIDRYNIVTIASLGGGTGSGIFPLIAALFAHIERHVMSDVTVRHIGIGIVPPLDIDPRYSAPPTEPVAYPNTYAALRNLATLVEETEKDPLRVPAYTLSQSLDETVDQTQGGPQSGSGISFEVEGSPFDRYWLVGLDHGGTKDSPHHREETEIPAMIADAVYAMTSHVPVDTTTDFVSQTDTSSPLGTVGYATVAVPHESLTRYCELEREYERVREQLETVIEPKIEELQQTRDTYTSALNEQIDAAAPEVIEWLTDIRKQLDEKSDLDPGFVTENDPREIVEALEAATDDEPPTATLFATKSLLWALRDGPVGSELRTELEQLEAEIRDGYTLQIAPQRSSESQTLERRLTRLHQGLAGQARYFRERLSEADASIRDLVPPTHETFTSDREHLVQSIDRLEADSERVSEANHRLDTLQETESLVDEYARTICEEIDTRLNDVAAELSHFRNEYDDVTDRLREIDDERAGLRESLTDPSADGRVFTLPLVSEALDDVTLEDVEMELTSIAQYRTHDFLAVDRGEIKEFLERCHKYSRAWPDTIAHHDISESVPTVRDETAILYHRTNESLVEGFVESLTGADACKTSSGEKFTYTDDPYRIEILSTSQGGQPGTLVGYQRLHEMAQDGTFDAMAGPYRDFRRGLAYPEWYKSSVRDVFEVD